MERKKSFLSSEEQNLCPMDELKLYRDKIYAQWVKKYPDIFWGQKAIAFHNKVYYSLTQMLQMLQHNPKLQYLEELPFLNLFSANCK